MPRRKPSDGQYSLIGEVYNFKLKYQPHEVRADTGEKIVVLRLPKEATYMERLASHEAANKLAGNVTTAPTKKFWVNKARDARRRKGLQEIIQNS